MHEPAVAVDVCRQQEDAVEKLARPSDEPAALAWFGRDHLLQAGQPEAGVGHVGERRQTEGLLAEHAADERRWRSDGVRGQERRGMAGRAGGQHARERVQTDTVDRKADQSGDQERFAGGMMPHPGDPRDILQGRRDVAVGRRAHRGNREQPRRVSHRLNLRQNHVERRPRPVAIEAAGVAVGRRAEQVERGGMALQEITCRLGGHVGRRAPREWSCGCLRRGIHVEPREGLAVERRRVLRVGHRRREVRLDERRRLQPHIGRLGRHRIVEDEQDPERHHLGDHEEPRETDDRPCRGGRLAIRAARHPSRCDPDAADERSDGA